VLPDFDPIEMKFRIKVEFDVLNKFPKFGCDQYISGFAPTRSKKIQLTLFTCGRDVAVIY